MKKIMGIDEAGRGPVLGDMFIGGVVVLENILPVLENSEITDSKKLSSIKREQLYTFILEICSSYEVKRISNVDIDENKKNEGSLNDLELENIAKLIITHHPDVVYIDALGQNISKFSSKLKNLIISQMDPIPKIIPEHRGDEKYKIVGAASILAKVHRDRSIVAQSMHYEKYGEIGSGYPSDEKTVQFLRKYIKMHHQPPTIARKTWQTCISLMDELVYQKKLDQFF